MREHLDTEDRLALEIGRVVRRSRRARRATQVRVAEGARISQPAVSLIERGLRPGIRLSTIARLCDVLDIDLSISARTAFYAGRRAHDPSRQQDAAHARISGHVRRRLRGWAVEQEVEVRLGAARGFIDVLAYRSGRLIVGEVKTELRDIGDLQRTMNWYTDAAPGLATSRRWRIETVLGCVFVLSSDANDERIAANETLLGQAFPMRSRAIARWLGGGQHAGGLGLVMVDPAARRRNWLIATTVDGRLSRPPYRDYADFMTRSNSVASSRSDHAPLVAGNDPPS